jgi:MFS transporter, ACS family, hexuronate transporter
MHTNPNSLLLKLKFRPGAPWIMLIWLLTVQVTVAIVGRSLAPLGPLIGDDLALSKAQIGLLPATLYLGQLFVSLPSGIMVDKWGAKYLLFVLSAVLGGSFILLSFSSSFLLILVILFIGGLGFGMIHTTTNSGIVSWFPLRQRGTAMGIKQMGMTAGSALATVLLLPLAMNIGWRFAVLIASLILISAGLLALKNYRENRQPGKMNREITPVGLKIVLKQIVTNKILWFISASAAVLSGIQITWNTFIVFYTIDKFGVSLLVASSLLIISEICGSLGRVIWGVISDTIFKGNRIIVFVIITLFTILNCVALSVLPATTPIIFIYLIAVFFGFCVSGFNGIWMNSATESVSIEKSGAASGFSLTVGSIGIVAIPPLFGLIVDQTSSYMFAWFFLILLSLSILFLLLMTLKLVKGTDLLKSS